MLSCAQVGRHTEIRGHAVLEESRQGARANMILLAGIKEYSDWPTIPQLYVDKEFVGGCDILISMHQNGELAKLLEEKTVLAAPEATEGEETKE